jgi:hypothetical protein
MKNNYMITLELPRTVYTKQGKELVVDRYTQFIYNRKNKESALRAFGSVANLRHLRTQGFALTRAEFKQYRKGFSVERVA